MKYPASQIGLVEWLKAQKPNTNYDFFSGKDCLVSRFLTDALEENEVCYVNWPEILTGIKQVSLEIDLEMHLLRIREYHRIGYTEKENKKGKIVIGGMTYGEALARILEPAC